MVIAKETGDERILARGLYSLGMVDQKAGKLREADAKLLRSVEICRRRSLTGPLVTDLTWLSAHADWRGEYRPSLQYAGEAARLAEASHEGFYELVSLCFLCNAHAGLGEWDLAFKFLDEVRQKSRERENKYGIARGLNTTGWLHRAARRPATRDRVSTGKRSISPGPRSSATRRSTRRSTWPRTTSRSTRSAPPRPS